ncbi:macrosialin [Puntigrus tetrazona]|uniref:macrosialin n=1 Tax=Puntigrus tetrazona TaxID=1606681 RepID=UPI001C8AE17A|nr:macrosialin [Puntigrus tetrazona]
MKYGLLSIAFVIAATALTSGDCSSVYASASATPTSAPSINTTTPSLNTTTPSLNTTTPSLNTTTHNPNTTTHNPNTTTHNPNTTTHNPNTTTSAPTTTPVPSPTSATNLTMGKYNVSDDKGICIMLDTAIAIRVSNSQVNGTYIVQPSKTHATGECLPDVSIFLHFDEGDITFRFKKNESTKKVYVDYVQYDLTYAFTPNVLSNFTGLNRSLQLFSVDVGHSYSCKDETVDMGNGVSLDLTQFRIQALEIKNNVFGPPDLCKADQPDYRVPIAVGIILIILIIIVVVAYLISRKRRTDGYQTL